MARNLADRKAVDKSAKRAKNVREREILDVGAILSTAEGRRFIWRLLGHCGVSESVMAADSLIYYNAGKQDVGHFLMAEIMAANPQSYITMMKEHDVDSKISEEVAEGVGSDETD